MTLIDKCTLIYQRSQVLRRALGLPAFNHTLTIDGVELDYLECNNPSRRSLAYYENSKVALKPMDFIVKVPRTLPKEFVSSGIYQIDGIRGRAVFVDCTNNLFYIILVAMGVNR